MPLPMKLWIALEDDVARHKEELAQGEAAARAGEHVAGSVSGGVASAAAAGKGLRAGGDVAFWRRTVATAWQRHPAGDMAA